MSMKSKRFAGIGSREVPEQIFEVMRLWSSEMLRRGYSVTTGGAKGSDDAFLQGALDINPLAVQDGQVRLYLPRSKFNGHRDGILINDRAKLKQAREILLDYNVYRHLKTPPRFITAKDESKLSSFEISTRQFHTRNVFQVLSEDFSTPVQFIGCWTPCGAIHYDEYQEGITGGTGIAINLGSALEKPIEVFNLRREDHLARICQFLNIPLPDVDYSQWDKTPEIEDTPQIGLF